LQRKNRTLIWCSQVQPQVPLSHNNSEQSFKYTHVLLFTKWHKLTPSKGSAALKLYR